MGHKLKLAGANLLLLLCILSVAKSGFAQGPRDYPRTSWGNYHGNPYVAPQPSYRHHQYHPYHHGHAGGRGFESVKASIHPLHIHPDNYGSGSYHAPAVYRNNPFYTTVTSSPPSPSHYSGYFYMQDKHRKPVQPPAQPFYTNAYYPSTGVQWTPSHVQSYPSSPSPPTPAYHHPIPISSRYPQLISTATPTGPATSASVDTYKEALDLFSEVVHKLEKETGHGYGAPQAPRYSNSPSSLLSNGIYGSSLPNSLTAAGFPHHLDHIMGPEFLQRAQKLYAKIIKEQNERGVPPHHYPYSPRPSPSNHYPYYAHGSRSPYSRGLSYLEGMIHGYGRPRPNPYARNMIVDPTGSSLVDTVKSLEVNVRSDHGSGEELMQTSESQLSPHILPTNKSPESNKFLDEILSTPLPQPSSSLSPEMSYDQVTSASTSDTFPRNVPLNENDFIEHPLPYEEYEGLIKDVALNPNY